MQSTKYVNIKKAKVSFTYIVLHLCIRHLQQDWHHRQSQHLA